MKRLFDAEKFEKLHKNKKFVIGINQIGFGEFIDLQRKNADVLGNITADELNAIQKTFENKNPEHIDKSSIEPDKLFSFLKYTEELAKSSIDFIQVEDEKITDKNDIDEVIKQFDAELFGWVSECFMKVNKGLLENSKKKN